MNWQSWNTFVFMKVVHVAAVVFWIGGVAFVTIVLLPAIGQLKEGSDKVIFFEKIEKHFSRQSKWTTLLTGLSGFWMLHFLKAWNRFLSIQYWWLHAMVLVWIIFSLILFILEPLFLHSYLIRRAQFDPEGTYRRILRMHRLLLLLSIITLLGAVAGAHGWVL